MDNKQLYEIETKNLRASKKSYSSLSLFIRQNIRKKNILEVKRTLPFLYINVAMVVENTLYQLIHNKDVPLEVLKAVYDAHSLHDKWTAFIKKSVYVHFQMEFTELPFSDRMKYTELLNFIDTYIKSLYEIRNKFAHGQLNQALNNSRDTDNIETTKIINKINYFDARLIYEVFTKVFYDMFLYGSVSQKAFSRQFDKKYSIFEKLKIRWDSKAYPDYCKELVLRENSFTHQV
ncbi:hypothetical protein [Leuconostoc pseudomesenteroides]|uniref:hypothetical protein n=1 Tax=Leuconostoc pseudomesenteroides TaxID=33968 RepID=UPI0039E8A216